LRPDLDEKPKETTLKQLKAILELEYLLASGNPSKDTIEKRFEDIKFEEEVDDQLSILRFEKWWKDGRVVCFICFGLTVTSVAALYCLSYLLYSVLSVQPENLCDFKNTKNSAVAVTCGVLLLFYCIKKLV
jgi:hypothetical protein